MTGVHLGFLKARYYEGSRGQFLSQDPVFLNLGVDPRTGEALANPQSLNAYSYARNNPINSKDPDGEWAHILIGAGAGMLGQYAYDVYSNVQRDGFNGSAFTNVSSAGTYLTRAAQGAIIAASGGLAAGAGIGVLGQAATVGVTSGVTGIGANQLLGQPTTPEGVISDVTIGAITYGAVSSVPKVPGRLPNFGTKAFMQGAHTKQSAISLGVDASSAYLATLLTDLSKALNELQQLRSESKSQDKQERSRK